MQHECRYFKYYGGQLVCSVCGKPAARQPGTDGRKMQDPAEDKMAAAPENKTTKPPARKEPGKTAGSKTAGRRR